jgi:hypothetical protein
MSNNRRTHLKKKLFNKNSNTIDGLLVPCDCTGFGEKDFAMELFAWIEQPYLHRT